jgi:V8-like Glu-specific endopeptidase
MKKIHIGSSMALAAIVFAGLGPTAAQAADPGEASTAVVAPTTFGRAAVKVTSPQARAAAAEDTRVKAYWTPQRLATAVPYESTRAAKGAARAKPAANGPAGSTPPAAPLTKTAPTGKAGGAVTPLAASSVTSWSNTNGKLFFNGYGAGNAYCSASALNTDTKRVIITAGHCVYDDGAWKQNPVFVPNYDNRFSDPDPVGIWSVYTMRTFNAWINDGDLTHDVGMATLYNGGDYSQRIVDAVGGHGLTWNGSYSFDVSIFGYPSNKTNPNGRYTMWACWGTTFQSGNRDSINGCAFGPGASGGPWLYNYSNTTGLGSVRSVTSTWNQTNGQNWAPYFNDDVKTMKDSTNGDW